MEPVTERLLLRQWREEDLEPFAALNADPTVMEHFPSTLDRAASDAFAERNAQHIDEHGWGLWAIELKETGRFLGFTGLAVPRFTAPFTPAVEVGWRLARHAWGFGFATEAATAAVAAGFGPLGLAEIVSFTAVRNLRSRAVMERIGMTHDPADDFDHPALPEGHALRRHVLYRLRRPGV
jgi:ribosomal-protein-alanine N-acetyltransferase